MPYINDIYQVNWGRLVKWLLPTELRRKKLQALLNALAVPVNDLHSRFLYFRKRVQYDLAITPQVCYLEKALNDRYDLIDRRIVIEDAPEYFPVVFYRKEEAKPVTFYRKSEGIPVIFYRKSETAQFGVDFIVKVPADVQFNMDEMRAFVTSYKLVIKTFSIQIV